ncbi:hypothetical protein IWX49DRAFT_591600 [Phyllosticta citricarpa]|uniref:Uncharacterized protein n=2 Tax=Phyllosticta TaxID=121621 RepID=A0ABR1MB11_9PEZI
MAYTQALISCSTAVVDNRGFRSAPMSTNNELVHSTSICGSMALTGVSGENGREMARRSFLVDQVDPSGCSSINDVVHPAGHAQHPSKDASSGIRHSRHASILWCERNLYIMPFNGDARQVPTIKVNGKLLGTGETGPLHAGSEIRFSDDLFDPFSAWLVTGISEGEPISVPPSAGDTMKTVVSHLCVACLVVVISKAYKR